MIHRERKSFEDVGKYPLANIYMRRGLWLHVCWRNERKKKKNERRKQKNKIK